MARRGRRGRPQKDSVADRRFWAGAEIVARHPMFAPLWLRVHVIRSDRSRCPADGWVRVVGDGTLYVHPTRNGAPEHWSWVLAHALLHLGLDHAVEAEDARLWNAACDCVVAGFLQELKIGRPPPDLEVPRDLPGRDVHELYRTFRTEGLPRHLTRLGVAGTTPDMVPVEDREPSAWWGPTRSWSQLLGDGIAESVAQAIEVAGGRRDALSSTTRRLSPAAEARSWFMSSYPLLGALAEAFELVEDAAACQRLQITVAAVDIEDRTIYVNPGAGLSMEEARFVMAHELLHVGLRHDVRQRGRDPFLWNVACDYAINGWLIEMQIGQMPSFGGLHDPELAGWSAESIYDRIARDLRTHRKRATLAGFGQCDMLSPRQPEWWRHGPGTSLDGFYRECLARGLVYHQDQQRGLLPAGLVEEIRALQQPPIPWDVELAQWFDGHFSPREMRRTYARPSRRQSSTPDIPRPRWQPNEVADDARTFGVVVDTSGSMDASLLGKGLGAIASFAMSRDVSRVRVVYCDAAAFDAGYVAPETIVDRVRVHGRGGTVLQPGIDLLRRAPDFPRTGPILVITDGACDRLTLDRSHAYLMPPGATLPFRAKGPVFRMA